MNIFHFFTADYSVETRFFYVLREGFHDYAMV